MTHQTTLNVVTLSTAIKLLDLPHTLCALAHITGRIAQSERATNGWLRTGRRHRRTAGDRLRGPQRQGALSRIRSPLHAQDRPRGSHVRCSRDAVQPAAGRDLV
ncbi:MAG: hypothetical protein OXC62_15640 [Aestuariivita sp.]|nr:hypothetical protein [Aestuariivita sp.]